MSVSERALEIKVGLFILLAAAILVGFAVVIGNLSFGRTWQIHVEYGFAGSLHSGAPVRVSGVRIGRVSRVDLIEEQRRDSKGLPLLVRVTLELDEKARGLLREDTSFHVGTAGVLGESYIDAVTGLMHDPPLEPGAIVRGVDPPRTDLLMARAYVVLESISEIIDDGKSTRDFLLTLMRLATAADELIQESPERLPVLLERMASAIDDLAALSAAARGQLEGGDLAVAISHGRASAAELRRELPEILAALRRASDNLDSAGSVLAGIDEKDLEKVRETLARYEAAAMSLEGLARDAQGLLERLERGEGTLGALIQDDQVYEDLTELLRDLKANPWKLLRRR